MAIADSANFYLEFEDPQAFDGSVITWTFRLPKSATIAPGVFRIEHVRTLAEEKALGNPVLSA